MADIFKIQCVGNRQIHLTREGGNYVVQIVLARPARTERTLATLVLDRAEGDKLRGALRALKSAK